MGDNSFKVRENLLRRMADRQRLRLLKSRRRDPLAVDFGRFMLVNADNVPVCGAEYTATAEDIEGYLRKPEAARRPGKAKS